MLTTLDRSLLASYFRSYLIVLTSVLGLYITLDLFTNLDDFSKGGFLDNLRHMAQYYETRISQIFDRLSEAVTLLAAVFTVAWLQRNNELLPQLSAGISTRRVIRPVLFGAAFTLALGPLNQEIVIPQIAEQLSVNRSDPHNEAAIAIRGAYDSTGVHIEGYAGYRKEQKVTWMSVTFPEGGPAGMVHLTAKEARYVAPNGTPHSGGWMLYQTSTKVEDPLPGNLEKLEETKYFLRTKEADFDAITRPANWFVYASAGTLRGLLAQPDPRRQPAVAVAFHNRLTRP